MSAQIAFLTRKTHHAQPGGDTVQIEMTASLLRKAGLNVTVYLSPSKIPYSKIDLLHIFNLGRPANLLTAIRKATCPIILSSIYVDFHLVDQLGTNPIYRYLKNFIGASQMEYLKTIMRGLRGTDRFPSFQYLMLGQLKSIERILNLCDVVITSTDRETERIKQNFNTSAKFCTIPLGADEIFHFPTKPQKRKGILCVGRIEMLKNQLMLIEICNQNNWPLTIVGMPASNQKSYYQKCLAAAGAKTIFIPHANPEALVDLYHSHLVHAGISFFETFHLASLEALICGCRPVMGKYADSLNFYGKSAFFADPVNRSDIELEIQKAMLQAVSIDESSRFKSFTWGHVAKATMELYKQLIPHSI
jgi:glycosyltransferase involved in cell wall biosynthesis